MTISSNTLKGVLMNIHTNDEYAYFEPVPFKIIVGLTCTTMRALVIA